MRGGWIVMLGLLGGCTAANPAFGDAGDGDGSTSLADDTTAEPTSDPTRDTTMDPTRAESSSQDDASASTDDMSGGTTQPMTSDDDTSTPTTSAEDGSSDVTGGSADAVQLFVAAIDDGHLSENGGGTAMQAGATICAEVLQSAALDPCANAPLPLIRAAPMPFLSPDIDANLGNPVVTLEGEAVADSLKDFIDGAWLVPSLSTLAAAGFADLAESSLASGGLANVDPNCTSWTTNNAEIEMTIASIEGGGTWFSAGRIDCSAPAHILCVCLQ